MAKTMMAAVVHDFGKPLVIEEIFPLKCSVEQLDQFIIRSRVHTDGWIGFYWGETPEELKRINTIPAGLTRGWLELFERKADAMKR